jgi:ferredoxin
MILSSNSSQQSIKYNDELLPQAFDSSRHKTTLSYLEEQGIEVHYQCLEGYCGACRCKLVSGEVEYPVFPMACIRAGEILTCCSVPMTNLELADPF